MSGGVPFVTIIHNKTGQSGYANISRFNKCRISQAVDAKANTKDITLWYDKNYDEVNSQINFNASDLIEVYADYDQITVGNASQLLLSGTIQEFGIADGEDGLTVNIRTMDRTVDLLGKLLTDSIVSSESYYAWSAINRIVWEVTGRKTTPLLVAYPGYGIQNTPPTGGPAFPLLSLTNQYKTAFEWITELSQPDMTGQVRPYRFYMDTANKFHWEYPSITADVTIGLESIRAFNLKKTSSGIVNMVIYNAGVDPDGYGIHWYYPSSSGGFFGTDVKDIKAKYYDLGEVSKNLETKLTKLSQYPYGAPGTYELWDNTTTNDYGINIANASAYSVAYRNTCKHEADVKCKGLLSAGRLRWKGTITLDGTNAYTVNDLVDLTVPMLSSRLRITDINHTFTNKGWQTDLSLEEDVVVG